MVLRQRRQPYRPVLDAGKRREVEHDRLTDGGGPAPHGCQDGKARQTPLAYFTEGRDVFLVASNGGARHHPSWLYNIRANPDVELWVGDKGGAHTARVATPDEKGRLWPKANALYAGYAGYQAKSGRDIQMVICSPKE